MSAAVAVRKADAEKVLAAVRRQFRANIQAGFTGPILVKDWEPYYGGSPVPYAVVWEDGSPYEWAYLFPHGGIEEEFGMLVKPVAIPDSVYVEPCVSFIVGIYPN